MTKIIVNMIDEPIEGSGLNRPFSSENIRRYNLSKFKFKQSSKKNLFSRWFGAIVEYNDVWELQ